jgi:hypothetical protein
MSKEPDALSVFFALIIAVSLTAMLMIGFVLCRIMMWVMT